MATTEGLDPGGADTPQRRLVALLGDIEALRAELEDLKDRIDAANRPLGDDGAAPPGTPGAQELAHRVAEELLRRGRAEIGVSLAGTEPGAGGLIAPVPARASTGTFTFPSGTPRFAGSVVEGQAAVVMPPNAAGGSASHGAAFGEFWTETEASAPGGWRRWARPAEILVHVVVLLVLVAVAIGAAS